MLDLLLFVLSHEVPAQGPPTTVPYTFVTDGIGSAIKQVRPPPVTSTCR